MLLFIHNSRSPFVINDLKALAENGRVNRFYYPPTKGVSGNLIHQLRLFAWLMFWLPRSEGAFCWFADMHSFFPAVLSRVFRKPFWVVLGGYDVISMPEYNYGVFSNPVRGLCARLTMRFARRCLAVSEHTAALARKHCPGARIEVLPNGADLISGDPLSPRECLVATVAMIDQRNRIAVKGIDRFLAVAEKLPGIRFILVGLENRHRHLMPSTPANVEVLPPMSRGQLASFFQKVKVYCQFSRSESFGLTALEAALCGAIPVITPTGALPEVLGEGAFVWNGVDPEAGARLVQEAATATPDLKWIESLRTRFSLQQRRQRLIEIIRSTR
jgi:glycosyltransferase involved in cell wall biosynthesis